jgi:eukaryotic-like serine/threonine-protein kinase
MFEPGSRIEKYEVICALGSGGIAHVFKVRHTLLGSLHVLKVLDPQFVEDPNLRARFLSEGQIQAQLRHPNIVHVTDTVALAASPAQLGIAGLVADFVDGPDLESAIRDHRAAATPDQVKAVFLPLLNALQYAHEHNIVHRDIKPSNIVLDQGRSGQVVPRLLDFGIAKIISDSNSTREAKGKTRTGARIGTPEYMSPEQVRGQLDLDHRTDIFSMAVTLFEFISGQLPFKADSEFDTMRQIVEGRPTPIRTLQPDVDPVLEACVIKGLKTDREIRFQSCDEFAALLRQAGEGRGRHATPSSAPVASEGVIGGASEDPVEAEAKPLEATGHDALCPKCGTPRGVGTSKCWAKGCDDVTPLSECPVALDAPPEQAGEDDCNHELAEKWISHCPGCGGPMEWPAGSNPACPDCDAPSHARFNFCWSCGLDFGEENAPTPTARGYKLEFDCDSNECSGKVASLMSYCPWCGEKQEWLSSESGSQCSSCERTVSADWQHCGFCGEHLEATDDEAAGSECGHDAAAKGMKYCPDCGLEMEWPAGSDPACPDCGARSHATFNFCWSCKCKFEADNAPTPWVRGYKLDVDCNSDDCSGKIAWPMSYCPWCGEEQEWSFEKDAECSGCDKTVSADWHYCGFCGKKFE